MKKTVVAWAALWRDGGKSEYLLGTPDHPCRTVVFETRAKARDWINEHYGYIRTRPDLRAEPFGWRLAAARARARYHHCEATMNTPHDTKTCDVSDDDPLSHVCGHARQALTQEHP